MKESNSMHLSLTSQNQRIFQQRRRQIAKNLNGHTALIPSGLAQIRNFKANIYAPVRVSSHFLYVTGLHLPNAVFMIDTDQCALYMHKSTISDALWHGATPSFAQISEVLGCAVYDIKDVNQHIRGKNICVLPQSQFNTAQQQSEWIGRSFTIERDAPLVYAMIESRLIHDEGSIAELTEAMKFTKVAHHTGMQHTQVGIQAHHVKAHMDFVVQQAGLSTAYTPIITPRGQVLHNHDYYDLLKPSDLLLVDFGAESSLGWATDVTRTWPVSGQWSPTQLSIYQLVWGSLEACIEKIQVGVEYKEIHATALNYLAQGLLDLGILKGSLEEILAANSTALFFPHGIGHLLGLDVHDMEDLGDYAGYTKGRTRDSRFSWKYLRLDRVLQENMALTIEPGFYQVDALLQDPSLVSPTAGQHVNWRVLEQFKDVQGIRIEDDVIVGINGPKVLSAEIIKDPHQITQMMSNKKGMH
jgi:Xaa-Pro aminopeptidase